MRINDQQVSQDEPGLILIDQAAFHILFIERIQKLIQPAARAVTVVDSGNRREPGQILTGLQEGFRFFGDDVFIARQHFLQGGPDFRAILNFQKLLDAVNVLLDPFLNRQNHLFLCIVKLLLFLIAFMDFPILSDFL